MIKIILGRRITNKKPITVVKAFPAAHTKCMKHFGQPTSERNPDILVVHCGINNLKSESSPEEIVDDIATLAKSMKNESNNTLCPELCLYYKWFWNTSRLDRTSHGDGILLYVQEDIPSTLLKSVNYINNIENFFTEINLERKKWLLGC